MFTGQDSSLVVGFSGEALHCLELAETVSRLEKNPSEGVKGENETTRRMTHSFSCLRSKRRSRRSILLVLILFLDDSESGWEVGGTAYLRK